MCGRILQVSLLLSWPPYGAPYAGHESMATLEVDRGNVGFYEAKFPSFAHTLLLIQLMLEANLIKYHQFSRYLRLNISLHLIGLSYFGIARTERQKRG